MDDEDLEKIHKLNGLVTYTNDVRFEYFKFWEERTECYALPSCVYTEIRDQFASPDGIYTRFKYAKKSTSKKLLLLNMGEGHIKKKKQIINPKLK